VTCAAIGALRTAQHSALVLRLPGDAPGLFDLGPVAFQGGDAAGPQFGRDFGGEHLRTEDKGEGGVLGHDGPGGSRSDRDLTL
jgi:hypothetical protein